jgi:CheY-like chemotaxis protein
MAKVLVVDDSQLIRRLVTVSLKARGHVVLEAEDGAQGLELTAAEGPDLIILDRQMPNVDGFEVVRRLRDDDATRDLPILMLSEDADGDEQISRAVDEFISKPFTPDELGAAVARLTGSDGP